MRIILIMLTYLCYLQVVAGDSMSVTFPDSADLLCAVTLSESVTTNVMELFKNPEPVLETSSLL